MRRWNSRFTTNNDSISQGMPDGKQMYGPRFPNPAMASHTVMGAADMGGGGAPEDERRRLMMQQQKGMMMVPHQGMRMMNADMHSYNMQQVRAPRPPGNRSHSPAPIPSLSLYMCCRKEQQNRVHLCSASSAMFKDLERDPSYWWRGLMMRMKFCTRSSQAWIPKL